MKPNSLVVRSIKSGEVFSSLTSAIESVRKSQLWETSTDVTTMLMGDSLAQVYWNEAQVVFHFFSDRALCVELATENVLAHLCNFGELASIDNAIERILYLEFSKLADTYKWNRAELLESRVGQRFIRLLESDFGLFIYFENLPTLLFSRIATVESSSRPLLFWDNCQ